VQWGTHARQRTVAATIATIADVVAREGLGAPVITVIGDVVALRDEIRWFESRPLFGKRVVVTRASAQAGGLRARLAELGAQVLDVPALRIELLDPAPLRAALDSIADYTWLVLTSQNAVTIFWDVLRETDRDARALAGLCVACVGRSTADALLQHGIAADVLPARFVAEGVLEELSKRGDVRGGRALYVAAEGARDVLPDGLRSLGCLVNVVHAYRSVSTVEGATELRAALERGEVDLATFASASAVRGYVDAVGGALAQRAPGVSIGPITSEALRAAGIRVIAEAKQASIDGLVEATLSSASFRS
jgi:uroporphyrinogen III methyltransferase/synthase